MFVCGTKLTYRDVRLEATLEVSTFSAPCIALTGRLMLVSVGRSIQPMFVCGTKLTYRDVRLVATLEG
jgi:hypothetical protein